MPKDKTQTYRRILPAAMKEFLEKGYEKATMREIARAAGITAAGLYRHFPSKEDMFAALVDPVLKELEEYYLAHKKEDYDYLEQGDMESMWEKGEDVTLIMNLVYDHFDEFKLLLCRSEGTKYANFLQEFTMLEWRETLEYMEAVRKKGIPVNDVRKEEIHLLMTVYADALFQVVVHDFTREQATHYMKTFQQFFHPGWRAILGL